MFFPCGKHFSLNEAAFAYMTVSGNVGGWIAGVFRPKGGTARRNASHHAVPGRISSSYGTGPGKSL